jgi:hypothetical protein
MDVPSIAESLPELYRSVLDHVAGLESAGHRLEGSLVRRDAIAAYSTRWNAQTTRRLTDLVARADRVLAGRERARLRRETRVGRVRRAAADTRARAVRWGSGPFTAKPATEHRPV